jgi:hypothetical protein
MDNFRMIDDERSSGEGEETSPGAIAPLEELKKRISDASVRYIKLGHHGRWESLCLNEGTIYIGFGTEEIDFFGTCLAGDWSAITRSLIGQDKAIGTATNVTNQLKAFFEDRCQTLWITFSNEYLYWGFTNERPAFRDARVDGCLRTMAGGWKNVDLHGTELAKARLSGALTQLTAFRGTSCGVTNVSEYVKRRIKGDPSPEISRIEATLDELKNAALVLVRQLLPPDFELLVDLVFSGSGWRRITSVGGTQRFIDVGVQLPSTGEYALIQVKTATSQAELDEYVSQLDQSGPYRRMFYVYHSSRDQLINGDERVTVIGPERLTDMVIEAGLVNWVIAKVS